MTLRAQIEAREEKILSPQAALSAASRGRQRPEGEHDYRTAFQRDRDRILHAKAFRRLKRKTQVFLAPEGDHFRTRLTHTLEAAQISRTVARALFLNEDLVEAIALGHDLGHTPFGHAGEVVLNEVTTAGFHHSEQSLRVLDVLETRRETRGLNLTWEVRDGIAHHSKGKDILEGRAGTRSATLEGQVVSVCDAVAYINHDVDDALRAQVIAPEDLPREALAVLGQSTSARINTMVVALIEGSRGGAIGMVPEVLGATNALRGFLYNHLYPLPVINAEIDKAKRLLRELYVYLMENPHEESLPGIAESSRERHTVDFIAGMTDQYALNLYARLFFPAPWPP